MKKCKSGYYYCNTDKKCKPIPRGYRVGYGGYLRKEKDDDDSKSKSNGNGNGNGNGSNGNGNGGNGSGGNGGGGNGGGMGEEITYEAKMTEKEKKKKEEIVMSMKKKKKDFEDRYGEDGKSVMYATATKLAMGEALNSDDKPAIKELIKKLKGSALAHKQQSKDLEKAMKEESNPRIPRKKGQPANSKKHSDLYTDENPKGTIHGLGFKDVATATASVSKILN